MSMFKGHDILPVFFIIDCLDLVKYGDYIQNIYNLFIYIK